MTRAKLRQASEEQDCTHAFLIIGFVSLAQAPLVITVGLELKKVLDFDELGEVSHS